MGLMSELVVQQRKQIEQLERAIKQCEQTEIPVTHHHAHGLYGREIFIPADTVLTGRVHKTETLAVILRGELLVTTPQGIVTMTPASGVLKGGPGTKRAGYALTDVVMVEFHHTLETELAAIEAEQVEPIDGLIEAETLQRIEMNVDRGVL